jgi:mono/diheme cytochrome c family protein
MWATFFGLLGENRFPVFKSRLYDPRITEGHIGVLVQVDESKAEEVERALTANGAHHMHRQNALTTTDRGLTIFWASVVGAIAVLGAVVLLIAFDVLKIHFPTQMADQPSIASQEGPRQAAPAEAVPIQGPELIAGEPATAPLPATADSIQRGQVMFGVTCIMCHGADGKGDGRLSGFFNPRPADLTSAGVQNLPSTEIFKIITEGRSLMPSMAETLDVRDRWDVINYVRTLKK